MNAEDTARRCAEAMFAKDTASRDMGIAIEVSEAGSANARMEISAAMVNGLGVCHGGYIFALADTAFAFACNGYGRVTYAAAASIDFVRSARLGDRLLAEASEKYRGRSKGIYDVVVSDQEGRLVALFRGRSHATAEPLISSSRPNKPSL
jgi:acyl-CoA thioesterase